MPPKDHDFSQGPWSCSHCDKVIWYSWDELTKSIEALAALKTKAGEDDDAKKEYDKILKEHADSHMDQMLYQRGALHISTSSMIVDPMHALQLNLGKVSWKWSFGNRMDPKGRERVAEYLNEIELSLDIREKGKRERSQKWFTASAFDEFVLGPEWDKKSKSPGLTQNIYEIAARVHADAAQVADAARIQGQAPAPPPPPAAPAPSKRRGKRARRTR